MVLPNSYTLKPSAISEYFNAMLKAQPPERFSQRFQDGLGFKSKTDRLFIGVLKELGFLDSDGVPQQRYFDFLDQDQSKRIVAQGVREAFASLFEVQTRANALTVDEVKNKLRTLYRGSKSENVIARIAATFQALCEYADFSGPATPERQPEEKPVVERPKELPAGDEGGAAKPPPSEKPVKVTSLQYHINIVLPESRDQAVYDAVFKSLRDHLGPTE